jgi:hypothetical protein
MTGTPWEVPVPKKVIFKTLFLFVSIRKGMPFAFHQEGFHRFLIAEAVQPMN